MAEGNAGTEKKKELLKEKCKIPNGMKYEYMHVREDLGGLGIDKLEDAVGYEKLKILLKGLNGKGKFQWTTWKTVVQRNTR